MSRSQTGFVIAIVTIASFAVTREAAAMSPWREQMVAINRCGPLALQVCAAAVGRDVTMRQMNALLPTDGNESSLSELQVAGSALGLETLAVCWDADLPPFTKTPAIIPVVNDQKRLHFVAILTCQPQRVLVLDFPYPPVWLPIRELRQRLQWDGQALHVARDRTSLAELRHQVRSSPRYIPLVMVATGIVLLFAGWSRTGSSAHRFLAHARQRGRKAPAPLPQAFTIIELIICLAVVGVLMSLVLPAALNSRESARGIQCKNNLRQMMQACTAHESAHGRFPPVQFGFGQTGRLHDLSPHFFILPYLEQMPLYNSVDQAEDGEGAANEPPTSARNSAPLATRVSVFECPSDSVPAGGTSYRACTGTGPSLAQTVPLDAPGAARMGAFSFYGLMPMRFRDGLSNTVFFSEKLVGDRDPKRYTAWRDYFFSGGRIIYPADAERACRLSATVTNPMHGSFGGSAWLFNGYANTWYNHVFTPNSTNPDCSDGPAGSGGNGGFTARSSHPGGVNVAIGGGEVRFVADAIDIKIWRALSTSDGREIVDGDN